MASPSQRQDPFLSPNITFDDEQNELNLQRPFGETFGRCEGAGE